MIQLILKWDEDEHQIDIIYLDPLGSRTSLARPSEEYLSIGTMQIKLILSVHGPDLYYLSSPFLAVLLWQLYESSGLAGDILYQH